MVTYIYDQPNLTAGIDDAILDVATAVPSFSIGLLFFVYIAVLFGGTSAQSRRTGSADFPMWNLLAALSIFLLSLLMTIKTGILPAWVLGVVVAINILSGFWFFVSKGRSET